MAYIYLRSYIYCFSLAYIYDRSNRFQFSFKLNQDVSKWDVSRVTDMSLMFYKAESFAQKLCENAWIFSTAKQSNMFVFSSGGMCTTTMTPAAMTVFATTITTAVIVLVVAGFVFLGGFLVLKRREHMSGCENQSEAIATTDPSKISVGGSTATSVHMVEMSLNNTTMTSISITYPSTVAFSGGNTKSVFIANDEFKTDHTTTSDNITPTGPVLATYDDDTATTAPALPSVQKTFATSNYKRFYERAKPASFQHNLLAAVHTTVALFATRVNPTLDEAAIEEGVVGFMEDIQDDAFKNDKALKTNVDCVAEYLWTSFKRHDILKRMELCSVLNAVIREDIAEEIEAAASIFRSINSRRVNREDLGPDIDPSYPRYGETWRGGGFRNHCRPFFDSMLGRKYRVSGFLATSSNRRVAAKFAFKADRDHPRALWSIRFDRRGKREHKYRVQHMSLVTKTLVKGEREYLFAPYSVFKLASVKWSTDLSTPHQLTIEAANDNRAEDEDLPLTPWY